MQKSLILWNAHFSKRRHLYLMTSTNITVKDKLSEKNLRRWGTYLSRSLCAGTFRQRELLIQRSSILRNFHEKKKGKKKKHQKTKRKGLT
jgi:hypothetical protein